MNQRASIALNDVDAFVEMFSAACGVPAWKLENWLEIYWKLRVLQLLEETQDEPELSVQAPTTGDTCAVAASEKIPEVPPTQKMLSGNGARRKREILERLQKARAAGVTLAAITEALEGEATQADVLKALSCQHLHTAKWEAISTALVHLGF